MMTTITDDNDFATLAELVDIRAMSRGDEPYLIDAREGRVITYRDLATQITTWRQHFEQWGLEVGNRVAVSVADPLDFSVIFLAGIAASLWVAPLDHSLVRVSPSQLDSRARQLGVNGVISDARDDFDTPFHRYPSPSDESATPRGVTASSGGVILASSGTTGTPKVIALQEAQLLRAATLVARHNQLSTGDRGFNALPLFHVNAEVVGMLATLVAGASLVLDERFHRTQFWGLMERHAVTWINAVPAIVSRLVPLGLDEHVTPTLRFCRSASAPLSPQTLADFESVTGIPIIESYGMTEAASQICVNPIDGVRKPGSVGRAVGVDLRIAGAQVDEALTSTPRIGPVQIRGASIVTSYEGPGYEDRFDDGWLVTGDLGYVDDDGYVFLVGRSDDVINRGGEKIFPREIEELLLTHPEVETVAVIGQPDKVFGQVPVAYVSLRNVTSSTTYDAVAASVEGMRKILLAELTKARRPASLNIVETLPTNATGKIRKAALRSSPPTILFCETVG